MFSHSTNMASLFSVLMATLIFSMSLAGVAWAQGNTSFGTGALQNNTAGSFNTAIGLNALFSNSIGDFNTASGGQALVSNTTGDQNTATEVNALFSNTTASFNTASGVSALLSNTTGPKLMFVCWESVQRYGYRQSSHRQCQQLGSPGKRFCHGNRGAGDV